MDILYRRQVISSIDNHVELGEFIKNENFYKHFKKIPDKFIEKINLRIKETPTLNYKGFKPWFREIVKYPESIHNKNFLLNMGWEIDEVISFISSEQKKKSKIISEKKKKNPEKYYDKTPKRVEYWLKKGFSMEESKKLLSESQKTFSKKICIEKHGKENGLKIFNKRQSKWIKTLSSKNDYDEINKSKNTYDYQNKSSEELINRSSFIDETKEIILEGIKTPNISDFVNMVISQIDIKSLSDIIPYINSKLIQNHFNSNHKEIKDLFYSRVPELSKTSLYGQPVYHRGNRFKSIKEYKIALLFESIGVEYVYEKKYPNSTMVCDFHLPKYDIYVEYYGLLDGKNLNNLDKIQEIYYDKMKKKNLLCEKNKLHLLSDTSFKKLYKKIKKQFKT